MKTCTICGRNLPVGEFNKKKSSFDGLQNVCRGCNRERSKKYYAENRTKHLAVVREKRQKYVKKNKEFVNGIKEKGCALCGERAVCCMDFHHVDGKKDFNISSLVRSTSSQLTLQREVAKCVCVCANCHRKIHAGLLQIKKEVAVEKERC